MVDFGGMLLAEAAAGAEPMTLTAKAVIVFIVATVTIALSYAAAEKLRMPDQGGRIALVLSTLTLALAICYLDWPPKKGIDLSGGVVLIYEVDRSQQQAEGTRNAVKVINDRLERLHDTGASVSVNSKYQIEVSVPEKDQERAVVDQIAAIQSPAFTLTPAGKAGEGDRRKLIYDFHQDDKVLNMESLISAVTKRINPTGVLEVTVRSFGSDQLEIIIPDVDTRSAEDIKRKISTSGLLEFWILADRSQASDRRLIDVAERTTGREVFDHGRIEGRWVVVDRPGVIGGNDVTRQSPNRGTEVLVRVEPTPPNGHDPNVKGKDLAHASAERGLEGPTVNFSLTSEGAGKFGRLTDKYKENEQTHTTRRLGIVFDDHLLSAPVIRSRISDNGQITGGFSDKEVNFLVEMLNAGSLPAALSPEPVSQQVISAQLGEETVVKGSNAMVVSTICVLIFMLVYYRFAGIVADVAVLMNMVLTMALMLMVNAAITLPGLAGFVLTVGMAVDANVLIYERMREESVKGASLRMTIRNGFHRAMSTIIDSHITTVISGIVLFVVGTDQIKGFAVTLVLGLVCSLYTAVYVARVIFDIAERKRWLTQLRMMQFIGDTNINFVRWRGPAIAASLVVIAIGMVAVVSRGAGLLDIDFTGGSSVQALFDQPKHIADVRHELSDLSDLAVSSVGDKGVEFKIDTSEPDIHEVERKITATFGKELAYYRMNFSDLKPYEESAKPAAPAAPANKTPAAKSEPGPKSEPSAENKASESKAPENKAPESAMPDKNEPEKKDTETKTPESGAAPTSEKQGAVGRVTARLVSWPQRAALAHVALAAADSESPATAAPSEAKPEAASAAASPEAAKASESNAPESNATKPEATQPEATKPETTKPEAAESKPEAPESKPAEPAPPTKGVTTELDFPQPISYVVLERIFEEQLKKQGHEDTRFELLNPDYKLGSSLAYKNWTLRIMLPENETHSLLENIQATLKARPVFPSSNQIGGKVAGQAKNSAVYALLAAMAMIVIYIWIRFQNVMFGFAAVLALLHDVLVTVGFLALSTWLAPVFGFLQVEDFKISLSVVAALLTIVGYSINDTIVIFDRIREIRGKSTDLNETMINLSVNQTLGRTLLTSGTVLIGTVILYFAGGQGIHAFAFAMLVGLVSGTYSTVYIASPVLLWLRKSDDGKSGSGNRQRGVAVTGSRKATG